MIRINVIGTGFLDMVDGGMSFKQDNNFFRFCDVTIGRTTEFSVPATQRNRKLLGFADDPARIGGAMRRKHSAQLLYDGGCMDGLLSVTSYEGDAFKCSMLLGSSTWLDGLLDLKVGDMVTSWKKGITWDSTFVPANDPDLYVYPLPVGLVKQIQYDREQQGLPFMPAVNLKGFLSDILAQRGVPYAVSVPREYWMVMPSIKGSGQEIITIASTGTTNLTVSQVHHFLDVVDIDLEWATGNFFGALVGGGTVSAKGFRPTENIEITFPSPFPTGCFLVQYASKLNNCTTIGGVTATGVADEHNHGEGVGALDGKTVTLKKGNTYFFSPNAWYNTFQFPGGWLGYQDTYHPFSFSFNVVSNAGIAVGDTWYLQHNMPDMTFFELLKSAALVCGHEIFVDPWDLQIRRGKYGDKMFKVCRNVVSVDRVSRCVEAWGNDTHDAEIVFESENYVEQPIKWSYSLDSDQATATKTSKIKFSEGGVGDNGILINDLENDNGTPKATGKKITIAYADGVSPYLQRVPDIEMVGYSDIAAESTCMVVKMRMAEAEYFRLSPNDVWLWRGMAYVWTSANWSDGVLTLTLQKVSQPAIPSP